MAVATLALFVSCFNILASASSSSEEEGELRIGTWNSFDILFSGGRTDRRNYLFSNTDSLFPDLDILCTQEAFSPNAVSEFKDAFNFNFEFASPDSPLLDQSCSDDVISNMREPGGRLYDCTQACKPRLLTSGVSWIFCIYLSCFPSLIDPDTSITNRDLDSELFDLGAQLDLTACGGCLWQSWYFHNDLDSNQGLTSDQALDKLLERCESDPEGINYQLNAGIILHSKVQPKKIEWVGLPSIFFIPRGYIKAEFDDFTVFCTHLEPPGTALPFVTFKDDLIDNGVTYWDQVLELETELLINDINSVPSQKNVILLGDHNTGLNEFDHIYNNIVDSAGLTHVFGDINEIDLSVNSEYCTMSCDNNMWASAGRANEIVDHILFRGSTMELKKGTEQRFLTESYEVVPGEFRQLSDHFGVRAVLEY